MDIVNKVENLREMECSLGTELNIGQEQENYK